MAGGPSTVALAGAVSDAGGFGFLAGATLAPERLREDVAAYRALTDRPFGINLFVPGRGPADPEPVAAYASRLCDAGLEVGEARWDDDRWDAKVEILLVERPAVASFTFGLPSREVVTPLRHAGVAVGVTVTTPAEAVAARDAGADARIGQGVEAGGPRGGFGPAAPGTYGLLALLQ